MPDMKRCLMVTGASMLHNTGYTIHVWSALRAIREVQGAEGPRPVLLAFESARDLRDAARVAVLRQQAEALGVEVVLRPLLPKKLPNSTLINVHWMAHWVRHAIAHHRIGIVHAQSHLAAAACARALARNPAVPLVFDVHGVDIEESLADGRLAPGSAALRLRESMQRESIRRADWLLPVSHALQAYLKNHGADAARARIVPCVSSLPPDGRDGEALRRDARAHLAVNDMPVVLYLGGASAWQQPHLIVESFAALLAMLPEAVLLLVTNNPDEFQTLVSEQGIDPSRYRIMTVPHAEVASVASAADVGLLIREDTLINRVASPTKFGEYLTMGVPVVLTESVADFAALTRQEEVGIVVPDDVSAEELARALTEILAVPTEVQRVRRERCRTVARAHLSFDSILPPYREIYA